MALHRRHQHARRQLQVAGVEPPRHDAGPLDEEHDLLELAARIAPGGARLGGGGVEVGDDPRPAALVVGDHGRRLEGLVVARGRADLRRAAQEAVALADVARDEPVQLEGDGALVDLGDDPPHRAREAQAGARRPSASSSRSAGRRSRAPPPRAPARRPRGPPRGPRRRRSGGRSPRRPAGRPRRPPARGRSPRRPGSAPRPRRRPPPPTARARAGRSPPPRRAGRARPGRSGAARPTARTRSGASRPRAASEEVSSPGAWAMISRQALDGSSSQPTSTRRSGTRRLLGGDRELEPGARHAGRERAYSPDVRAPLGDADDAARVEQVEGVAALQHLVVGRQRQAGVEAAAALGLVARRRPRRARRCRRPRSCRRSTGPR